MAVHLNGWQIVVVVVNGDEVVDALHEMFDARERTASNGLVGDRREEARDLIDPKAVCRDLVRVLARPARL